jgi:hypothetical protein
MHFLHVSGLDIYLPRQQLFGQETGIMPKKPYYSEENLNCRRSIGYLVRRLHNVMVPEAEARFAAAEISFTQWVTLMGLREGIAKTCAEVANHLGGTRRIAGSSISFSPPRGRRWRKRWRRG